VEKREFKDRLYEQFARIGQALASPHRLELIDLLAQGERSVEDLAAESNLSVANASQHLRALHQAELVATRRQGNRVLYRLEGPQVFTLWQSLRTTAEAQLAEIDRVTGMFLSQREDMEAIGSQELLRRLESGEVTLLDVRPRLEYEQGHILSARSIPVDELEGRISELPKNGLVVAYCRGPYCVYADEAVALLSSHGRQAARLEGGYPDWAAAGLPIQSGANSLSGEGRS
jgi:rhodanese-related sulfurtransferase